MLPIVSCFALLCAAYARLVCNSIQQYMLYMKYMSILSDHPTHKHILHVFLTKTTKMHQQQLKKEASNVQRNWIQQQHKSRNVARMCSICAVHCIRYACVCVWVGCATSWTIACFCADVWVWKCEHKRDFFKKRKEK